MSRPHDEHRPGRHRAAPGPRPGGATAPGAYPSGPHHVPAPRGDTPDGPGPPPARAGSDWLDGAHPAERTVGIPHVPVPHQRERTGRRHRRGPGPPAPPPPPDEQLLTGPPDPPTTPHGYPSGRPAETPPPRPPVDRTFAANPGTVRQVPGTDTGHRGDDVAPQPVRAALDAPATATATATATAVAPTAERATRADRDPSAAGRLLGVDVARGVALFGIIAVHALVEGGEDGAPAVSYLVFGGRSAALFALLAGVALAFMTGRARTPWAGFGATAAMVATRAGVLLVIGLALGWTDPEIAAVILPYYAVMFLLAIPLLLLPTGALTALTVVLVGAVPVLSQLVRPSLPVPTLDNPHLVDLVTDPGGLLSELTVTGAYPAATWLAYLAAGIVVGRLRLSSTRTAATLLGAGTALAVVATGVSWWLLTRAGGYDAIAAATSAEQRETAPTIVDYVNVFPDGVTPTTTWWWLATTAPHSGTPLDLAQTIGSALAVLGATLLLAGVARRGAARVLGYVLRPVAAAGSMTLTLYVASLLFMNSPLDSFEPVEGYLWQVGAALVIGTAWRRAVGRGPLEAATSMLAHAARDRVRFRRGAALA